MTTKQQVESTIATLRAIADTIRELKQVPSGILYSQVMAHMDLATYQRIIEILKGSGLITELNQMLTWVGPKEGE